MNNFETSLSDILQALIHGKRLSIAEVARRTNVPQPTISRIINGEHQRPHKKTLVALSDFFNITVDQLIGLEPLNIPQPSAIGSSQLPVLNCKEINSWPQIKSISHEYVTFDKPIGSNAFALKMPDKSMEPLLTKDTLLIIDPAKEPEYRSLVVVKLHNFDQVVVRQLIKDAGNCYIRPLNQDFDQFEMMHLTAQDSIKGIVVEARLNCEGL